MNRVGPNTPPEPPELIVNEVAKILAIMITSISTIGISPRSASWIWPHPPPYACGTARPRMPIISPPIMGLNILGIFIGLKMWSRMP